MTPTSLFSWRLDRGPSRVPGAPAAHLLDEEHKHANSAAQPEQRIEQVYPDRVLHALDAAIALRVRMDVELPKDAKDGDPENEKNCIPDEEKRDVDNDRDHIDERRYGTKGPYGYGVALFSQSVGRI